MTTLLVNSVSNLIMVLVLAVPTLYFIVKTSIYQSTFENPRTIVKLTKFNITNWITKDDSSFLIIFIWTAFLVIASLVVVAQTIQGNCYEWVGIIAGVFAVFGIWGAIKTFELEIDKIYPKEELYR